MSNKLLLQDLTDQLAVSGKLKKKDADDFLRAFFRVVEDALFEGDTVKIQGLGTFKLIQVDSRKSVNVTTGEDFEIKEHFKVSFTPDATLRELVNKPFEHLEPVELTATPVKKTHPDERKDLSFEKRKEGGRSALPERNVAVKKKLVVSKEEQYERSREERYERPSRSVYPSQEIPRKEIKSTDHRVYERSLGKERTVTAGNKSNPPRKSFFKNKQKATNVFRIVFIFAVVSFSLWAVISNELAHRENEKKVQTIQQLDSVMYEEVGPEEFKSTIKDSAKLEAEIAAKVESIAVSERSEKPAVVKTEPVVGQVKAPLAKPDIKGPGFSFPATVTLGQGEMLTQYSLKYYGHKAFWVYIYLANKQAITDPDHIPLGTKLVIPKPDPALINSSNPDCIAKAKALQTKILSEK